MPAKLCKHCRPRAIAQYHRPHHDDERAAMKRITDRSFRYSPSFDTDIRRTFARVKREQSRSGQPAQNVCPIEQVRKKVAKAG
jgi:hypothetical protein